MRDAWGFTQQQVLDLLLDHIESGLPDKDEIDRSTAEIKLERVENWGRPDSFAIKIVVDHEKK